MELKRKLKACDSITNAWQSKKAQKRKTPAKYG
jgi:hypothetical protein